ncbi:MAG: PilC/PilY family type IV pilus protein [Steroidobacteraceae bacterium]
MRNRIVFTSARRLRSALLGAMLVMAVGTTVAQTVSQVPLSVAVGVPGNLILTPSVEWPTLDSVANIGNDYVVLNTYTGYFDSNKCYNYNYSATETSRYFYPVSVTGPDHNCSAASKQWSGNFLNWTATQTIDPFRKALTGGNRTTDTATTTILEKAYSDGNIDPSDPNQANIFPDRDLIGLSATNIALTVPVPTTATWSKFRTRIRALGNKMRFTEDGDLVNGAVTAYNPAWHTLNSGAKYNVYEVSIRVRVCVPTLLETNCVQYGSNWKPEGLIQTYSDKLRYSVFAYLNEDNLLRDGAALRARQKFVGPQRLNPATNMWEANTGGTTNKEWNADGTLIQNPDPADAAATPGTSPAITNSGVINYLNKFGQMTTINPASGLYKDHKSYDSVSEMYYAAIRYVRNLANIPEYTTLTGTGANRYNQADGFPVITSWQDPMQYSCQNNAILGIGDTNTWDDQNLKGVLSKSNEPATPALVSADTVNVKTWLDRVATVEGITIPTNPTFNFASNSAYMVGLAYYAHTTDLRTEASMPNKQTVSTHWVDVRENQYLRPKNSNQYWLAAKYGGFTVPEGYDSTTATAALSPSLWNASGENLSSSGTPDLRPDNFYVASEADKMVESLTNAFANISEASLGTAISLAANSTSVDTSGSTRTFQAQFSTDWSGDLSAFAVSASGALAATPAWVASTTSSLAPANWASRSIYTHIPTDNVLVSFAYANLSSAQKTAMGSTTVVDYIRGDRTLEKVNGGTFRTRANGLLGDIVNSTPIFVSKPNPTLYNASMGFPGASTYAGFASAKATRTGVIWVGANDGMLHGFNASNGQEIFAFVPKTAIANGLAAYSTPNYVHKYFVDGEIAIADVYDGANWRTILVGTLGRGGPGAFALDVTNPVAGSGGITLLWDKDGTDIPGLGKNLGKPVIAQTASGVWQVLIGNGPGSSTGTAKLIAINVLTGATTTVNTDGVTTNGLSAVLARDSNGDRFADTIYAGDLKGRLWKITDVAGTPAAATIFTAVDPSAVAQPITAAPLSGKDPATGITWVFFGTGKFFHDTDIGNTQTQTWYGIQDTGVVPTRALTLAQRSVVNYAYDSTTTVRTVTLPSAGDMTGKLGWYIDLPSTGERMVVSNQFQGGALIGTTRIPDGSNVCKPTGKGFIMAINPFTGGRLAKTFFDLNGDGLFNDSDKVVIGGTATTLSGLGFDDGANAPIFLSTSTGSIMYTALDDTNKDQRATQGSAVDTRRLTWREIRN